MAVTAAVGAQRFPANDVHHPNHHWPVSAKLKPTLRLVLLKRVRSHDRWVLATAGKHTAHAVALHHRQLRWTLQRITKAKHEIALLGAARWGPYAIPPASWISDALCVHSHEGSWTDSGDPYWGGMQMDRSFMGTYGSWAIRHYGGYANVWPARIQLAVSYRAWKSRGWYPWPNTARACGLL